ncbi:hypothetical protein GN244_ATG00980 [Phytophthora infestans]|uniref:Myb/SANT-like domain-containing protein n=1 Tax=Phytophthora infestans TaxID=4787 RepID=A0A833TGS7_PHYIN|nr:hypothetical protein GN244_ATG00980 [Phytophthora infestans]
MSTRDDAAAAQRATWTRGEELALLERYFEARKDPSKATDKGQYKFKVQRLMQDYDLFKEITSLSRCGRIKEMRKNGFEHATICSLIAGDSRATGADAESVQSLLGLLDDATEKEESALPQPNGNLLPNSGELSSVTDPAAAQDLHPSHERRVQTVKRIRDGASKTRRNKKRRQSPSGDFNEELGALLKTFTVYIKYKMRQEMGDQAPQSDSAAFAASPSSDD